MLDRHGHLPGYTGHIPKIQQSEEAPEPQPRRPQLPNYMGFIPGVKSENLFGKTYGKITEMSALGTYNKGRDMPTDEKFKSITQENYTNQLRIHVPFLHPKEYPLPPEDPISQVPLEALNAFFGVRGPGGYGASSTQFYVREEHEQGKGNPVVRFQEESKLSYEEARKAASQ